MITAFFTGVVLAAAVVSQAFQRAFPDFTDRQLQVGTFRIRMADSAGDCNIHVFFPALILFTARCSGAVFPPCPGSYPGSLEEENTRKLYG